jgi:HPt (histidine-containing phosphotransfer) domain-containing protein
MTVQELYESIGGNYNSAKQILQMDKLITKFVVKFLDDQSCEKLMSAAAAGDEKGMFEGAHAMKGVCANLGLNDLSAAASVIAEEFRPGAARTMDQAALDKCLADLKDKYDQTVDGIRRFAAEQ